MKNDNSKYEATLNKRKEEAGDVTQLLLCVVHFK